MNLLYLKMITSDKLQLSERQFNIKAPIDSFDEIYTNNDVSANNTYIADSGYPFEFPARWLNDPSMNKRIAIRRLDVIPTTHSFTLQCLSHIPPIGNEDNGSFRNEKAKINITEHDNLIKVLAHICDSLSIFNTDNNKYERRLLFEYDESRNYLKMWCENDSEFITTFGLYGGQKIGNDNLTKDELIDDLIDFLHFLNQDDSHEMIEYLHNDTEVKEFYNVWSRDRLYIHASFSTSRRKYIGKRGDFYPVMNLLYPLPSNESTFSIFFSSDGKKTILIKYCNFDVQLCFITNYKNSLAL